MCRDKLQKYSPDGRSWYNFSAWRPNWSAECWYDRAHIHRRIHIHTRMYAYRHACVCIHTCRYDLALIRRDSPLLEPLLLSKAVLPPSFCKSLRKGWFPEWIRQVSPHGHACACACARACACAFAHVLLQGLVTPPPLLSSLLLSLTSPWFEPPARSPHPMGCVAPSTRSPQSAQSSGPHHDHAAFDPMPCT